MTYQAATLLFRGRWEIIHDDKDGYNPFKVYYTYYENGNKHRLKVTEYADLNSAMYVLSEVVKNKYGYTEAKQMFGFKRTRKKNA